MPTYLKYLQVGYSVPAWLQTMAYLIDPMLLSEQIVNARQRFAMHWLT